MSNPSVGIGLPVNSPRQVLFASLVGTTIEFFDFYIYATAAVLVFPKLFFPAADPATATLASLATFGIAFLARPIGSALFGHFGDRIGRKTTLVMALATMGVSTVSIGCCRLTTRLALLPHCCWLSAGLGRGWVWAASGVARCFWRLRMLQHTSGRGMGCFRNWGRRWDSFFRAECFWGCRGC